jgi:uncharacterized membrane protein
VTTERGGVDGGVDGRVDGGDGGDGDGGVDGKVDVGVDDGVDGGDVAEDAGGTGPADATPAGPAERRIRGVDAARGVALLGMMSVHVLPLVGFAGLVHSVAAGRSAALFATLAGVGLALASGGATPRSGSELWRARRATLARGAVVAVVGLTLGGLPTPAAVILAYYAVLFAVAVLVLGWPARRLAIAAVVAGLGTPVLSHLLRLEYGRPPGQNLSWSSLSDPAGTLVTILLTGYYPVLTWTTYLFAGLAVGRLPLRRPGVAARVAAVGAAVAAAAALASWVAVRLAGGEASLAARVPPASTVGGRGDGLFDESFFGTTPVSSWWFLGVPAPHSGSIPDMLHTTGTSLAVLGLALLAARRWPRAVLPLAMLGSMTLTLYTLHVFTLGVGRSVFTDPDAIAWPLLLSHVVLAGAVAAAWRTQGLRGPFEELAATAARAAAGPRRTEG